MLASDPVKGVKSQIDLSKLRYAKIAKNHSKCELDSVTNKSKIVEIKQMFESMLLKSIQKKEHSRCQKIDSFLSYSSKKPSSRRSLSNLRQSHMISVPKLAKPVEEHSGSVNIITENNRYSKTNQSKRNKDILIEENLSNKHNDFKLILSNSSDEIRNSKRYTASNYRIKPN